MTYLLICMDEFLSLGSIIDQTPEYLVHYKTKTTEIEW